MKTTSRYSRAILAFLSIFICYNANSQKLLESRQTSFYTYIYKISDKEARKIYRNDIWKVDSTFFHTVVDSFPTDSLFTGKLLSGHYLKRYSEGNLQKVSITTIQNFDVFILNNNTDLCVQVYDLQGNIISDAEVRVGLKKLHFNSKSQSYLDKKSNRKGLLEVTYKGFTTYYNLDRQYNNSFIKRGYRKTVYGTPIRYIWVPVNFAIHLPVDAVKTAVSGWPQGTISRTMRFFENSFYGVLAIFDDYYDDWDGDNKFEQKYKGYLVFNKPKYQPGDTVKFKAFIVTKKGKPLNEKVNVVLDNYGKKVTLAKLDPYSKGGYEYQFFLHDSLQLQLDRRYTISLRKSDSKGYISEPFEYEDYELTKTRLSIRTDLTEQYRNQALSLFIKGTDENDLNLLDARIEVLATSKSVYKYFKKKVFIPDTLLFIKKKLEPAGETEIIIPDSVLPPVNFDYEILVRLLLSDNESLIEKKQIHYEYSSKKFDIEYLNDSIKLEYEKNGITLQKKVVISAGDNFGNSSVVFEGFTPCSIDINPFFSNYTIESDSLTEVIDMSSEESLIKCFSERTSDSVFIEVDNPRKIPFSYSIYRKNARKDYGYTDSLDLKRIALSKQNWFISLRYLWGGKIREENYSIPLSEKKLNVKVTQPFLVYPGQNTDIEVLVTDINGKPVEGVDLTAYSVTKKFNETAPELPYLGKTRKNKELINNFTIKDRSVSNHNGMHLNYDAWKLLAGIDSIEYYRFLYPGNSIYRFEYPAPDSLTQFAPFVVHDGNIIPVHVIYVDSKPVYFSWSTNPQPYSFKISEGYHQVKLRTGVRRITIDSLFFTKGMKTIFSLNDTLSQEKVISRKAEPELSSQEQDVLYKYIFPYRNDFGVKYAYIEHDNQVQLLNTGERYYSTNFAGPVAGGVTFNLIDGFSTYFSHEPMFEYDFAPQLLKMRSINKTEYPKYLSVNGYKKELSDLVLTKKKIIDNWNHYLDSKRNHTPRYHYPSATTKGSGQLTFCLEGANDSIINKPLNILVFRYDTDEFLRVYPGNTSTIHELREGYHKLLFFYTGAEYHVEDSILIKPDGVNYYEFDKPEIIKRDNFSIKVSDLIEDTLFGPAYPFNEKSEKRQITNAYQQQFVYTGEGKFVEGYVFADEDGEPLPGVTVTIEGTNFGTLTDINGYYLLKVPSGNDILKFSFVGMNPQEIPVDNSNRVNATLTASRLALDEVVVVAYGIQTKKSLTGSISVIKAESLTGYPGVNAIQSLEGRVAGISISESGAPGGAVQILVRGASSVNFDTAPLYIINGIAFMGNISELDPSLIDKIEILKGEEATALYGARAANGVVIIVTKGGAFNPTSKRTIKGADFDYAFLESASQAKSIRENFSDYGFWKPVLKTGKDGKTVFNVTFPDDVTNWDTYYLAMNGRKQSGQTSGSIKSFKPLMAQLAVPRFLVQSDSAIVIGKVLNYTPDSVKVKTQFEINKAQVSSKTAYCTNSIIDSLIVIAPSDSITIKYFLEKEDGYSDGELREIPIFPAGLEETKGGFYVLDNDTTISLSFDKSLGKVNIYARADVLDVIKDEISRLIRYKYHCNEQIASKIKAMLAEKSISENKGEKYKSDKEIEKLIRLIKKNQKENGLWGWWKDSYHSEWISLHVLEALTRAESMGYTIAIDKSTITEKLVWDIQNTRDFDTKIRILRILNLLNAQVDYNHYIEELEKNAKPSLNGLLQIIELKQLFKLEYRTDTLDSYRKETLFGNTYYSKETLKPDLLENDIQNTILAYRILRRDSIDHSETLTKIRNYFFETRNKGYWTNTFESAQIIETILPELLGEKRKPAKPSIKIEGDLNETITKFPYEVKLDPEQKVIISKSGDFPVYLTSYQRYWNSAPAYKKGDFEITTRFNNETGSLLKAGQEVTLIAEVTVENDADYVMINIPIPAGCSYAEKNNYFRNESHREYFRNETSIFCQHLLKGKHTFSIKLMPRYTGTYTLNPAKVELMYFPTFNANNESKKIKIK